MLMITAKIDTLDKFCVHVTNRAISLHSFYKNYDCIKVFYTIEK